MWKVVSTEENRRHQMHCSAIRDLCLRICVIDIFTSMISIIWLLWYRYSSICDIDILRVCDIEILVWGNLWMCSIVTCVDIDGATSAMLQWNALTNKVETQMVFLQTSCPAFGHLRKSSRIFGNLESSLSVLVFQSRLSLKYYPPLA